MICNKCGLEVPDGPFCNQCGKKQAPATHAPKSRGNGTGTVYKMANGKYRAVKTYYYVAADGKKRKKTPSKVFTRRRDAFNALPLLGKEKAIAKANRKAGMTFKGLYDLWLPTHKAGKDTVNCYKAAMKYFEPLYFELAADVDVDDLQDCIDDCPKGKSTRKNMRTVVGLIYKYGLPRGYFPEKLNLADYLTVSGEDGVGGVGLPDTYVEKIRQSVGKVPGADYVLAQCYLGFRPAEFLALEIKDYDAKEKVLCGGAKTDAGKNRLVTVSPKVQPIINRLIAGKDSGPIFCASDGSQMDKAAYRELFYALLDKLELSNPTFEVDGKQRHTYTPHSCRHTFATLMKRVTADSKDKLALIGHTSEEMLRYYQDVSLSDLRAITDNI